MPTFIKSLAVMLCVSVLCGCANKPREVVASVPLVTNSQEKPNKKEIPAQYWSALSDANKIQLQHDKYQVKLGALYTSALGSFCRELTLVDAEEKIEKRIACEFSFINTDDKKDKAWFLEKEIIESTGHVEL